MKQASAILIGERLPGAQLGPGARLGDASRWCRFPVVQVAAGRARVRGGRGPGRAGGGGAAVGGCLAGRWSGAVALVIAFLRVSGRGLVPLVCQTDRTGPGGTG